MELLEDEFVVSESPERALVLTTRRVRIDHKEGGQRRVVSITLDAVASCGLITVSHPLLLLLAALSFVVGIAIGDRGSGVPPGLLYGLAVVFLIAYFLSRSATLEIASAGQAIRVQVGGAAVDQTLAFIDDVEQAKVSFLKVAAVP